MMPMIQGIGKQAGMKGIWGARMLNYVSCRFISAYSEKLLSDLEKRDNDILVKDFSGEWQRFAVIDFDEISAGRMVHKRS